MCDNEQKSERHSKKCLSENCIAQNLDLQKKIFGSPHFEQ